jgi:ELWxxDGT repeat protein
MSVDPPAEGASGSASPARRTRRPVRQQALTALCVLSVAISVAAGIAVIARGSGIRAASSNSDAAGSSSGSLASAAPFSAAPFPAPTGTTAPQPFVLQLIADIYPSANNSFATWFTQLTRDIITFVATDAVAGEELWSWQPLPAGASASPGALPSPESPAPVPTAPGSLSRVTDIIAGPVDSSATLLAAAPPDAGLVAFSAVDPVYGREPWIAAAAPASGAGPTAVSAWLAADVNPGPNSSFPYAFTWLDGAFYFSAEIPAVGRELWRLNLPSPLPVPATSSNATGGRPPVGRAEAVRDICPGACSSFPLIIAVYRGQLFFSATSPGLGTEPWVVRPLTTGPAAGAGPIVTQLLVDLAPGPASSFPGVGTVFRGELFFPASGRLWRTDGTAASTSVVPFWPLDGRPEYVGTPIAAGDSVLYMPAADATHGTEVWIYRPAEPLVNTSNDTAPSEAEEVRAVSTPAVSPAPVAPEGYMGMVADVWRGSVSGFYTSGALTPAAAVLVGPESGVPGPPRWLLFFAGQAAFEDVEPWVTDGIETRLLADLRPEPNTGSYPGGFTGYKGWCYFTATILEPLAVPGDNSPAARVQSVLQLHRSNGLVVERIEATRRISVASLNLYQLSPLDRDAVERGYTHAFWFGGCDAAAFPPFPPLPPGITVPGIGCEPYRLLLP